MAAKRYIVTTLSIFTAYASLVGVPSEAKACDPAICGPARSIVDWPGTVVLPSTVGIAYLPSWGPDAGAQVFRLLDAHGEEVPTSVQDDSAYPGGKLLVPSAPLVEGATYGVAYEESCGGASSSKPVQHSFEVGPALDLPTTIGTLVGSSPSVGERSFPDNIVCSEGERGEGVESTIRLTPSAELRPFLPFTVFEMVIDGSTVRLGQYYGNTSSDSEDVVIGSLIAPCAKNDNPNLLSLGKHTIAVRARVAGATSAPPEATTEVTLSCVGEVPDGEDGEVLGNDAGVTTETPDASPPGSNASPAGGGGCSTTGGSTGLFGSGGALLAGVALALRARAVRRRPRR